MAEAIAAPTLRSPRGEWLKWRENFAPRLSQRSAAPAMSGAGARRRHEAAAKPAAPDLLVFGYEARFFHQPAMAADIEAGRHLMPCHGREDTLVDRFDVRLLLENLDQFERPSASLPALSERERVEEVELDKLRYEDMEAAETRVMEGESRCHAPAPLTPHQRRRRSEPRQGAASTWSASSTTQTYALRSDARADRSRPRQPKHRRHLRRRRRSYRWCRSRRPSPCSQA